MTHKEAIEQALAILGPEAPLCSGCVEEWTEALRVLREALAAPQTSAEPVAYMHIPSVAFDNKVRPVLSFEKYEGDYNSGIYAKRIPLYTHAPDDTALLRQALEALELFERFRAMMTGGPDSSDKLLAEDYAEMGFVRGVAAITALRERLGGKA